MRWSAPRGTRCVLERQCAGDAGMLRKARSLICAYDSSTGVIDKRTDEFIGLGGPDLLSLSGQRIGKYRLTRVIAEGAMAAVYQAQELDPPRTVGLKLFRTNMTMLDAHQRFRREAQALARLQHPHIARIYEASVHTGADGRAMPYIAMEFVDGLPLTQHAARAQAVARETDRAADQSRACRTRGPSTGGDSPRSQTRQCAGGPRRRAKGPGFRHRTHHRRRAGDLHLADHGRRAAGHARIHEPRAGSRQSKHGRCALRCMGAGCHAVRDTGRSPADRCARREYLRGAAPPRACAAAADLVDRSDAGGRPRHDRLDGAAPDKSQRYASAQALADDLRRYLRREPIAARLPTTWYVLGKFAQRNRGKIAVAAVITGLLIGGMITTSIGFVRQPRTRPRRTSTTSCLR